MAKRQRQITIRKSAKQSLIGDFASDMVSIYHSIFWLVCFIAIYRLGCYVTVPFINTVALDEMLSTYDLGVFSIFNFMSGGSIMRMDIFSLSVLPYISASIIVHIASHSVAYLKDLKKEGATGVNKMLSIIKYLTLLISIFQGYGLSRIVYGAGFDFGIVSVTYHTFLFSSIICMTAGSMFLLWMSSRITRLGFGSGISIIIFIGIVAELPSSVAYFFESLSSGIISPSIGVFIAVFTLALLALCIAFELARVVIEIHSPGAQYAGAEKPTLPLKVNACGVMPIILASMLLSVPLMFIDLMPKGPIFTYITYLLTPGTILNAVFYSFLIAVFVMYYLPIAFNADEIADNLKKQSSFVHGYRPGPSTAEYLRSITNKISIIATIYLIFVCIVPGIVFKGQSVFMNMGGATVLIIVSVAIDMVANISSIIMMKRYQDK